MARSDTLMERRKQAAVEEIARVALELCARDGFAATNVEAIAAAAGCSPRTFYRYFETKEDVMFHDLPSAIEHLGEVLDGQLADGVPEWTAVSEAVIEFISRFDVDLDHRRLPSQRMQLWLTEPALRARYLGYVNRAEETVVDCLCRHRETTPDRDDVALLIAVAAIGATRVSMLTHTPSRQRQSVAKHLRASLEIVGEGLARASSPKPQRRARAKSQKKPAAA